MNTDRMQRQRFEKKYRISEEVASQVREFVASYLELDEHGARQPDLSYPVHSLYLDSDSMFTYWSTINGDRNRFKLRIRFYNDHPDSPVFLEIKRRIDHCILKQRGGVRKLAVPWILAGQLPSADELWMPDPKQVVALERFSELRLALEARPTMHVAYRREAWVDPHSDAIRVTMDRQVAGEPEPTIRFATAMQHPCTPFGKTVILELKFTDRFPDWCREMVQTFNLVRGSAAKYCEVIDRIGLERVRAQLDATRTTLALEQSSLSAEGSEPPGKA